MTIAFDTSTNGEDNGSSTSIAATAFNLAASRLVVVAVRWESGGAPDTATATISDTAGNTYTLIGYSNTTSGGEDQRAGLYYSATGNSNASNVVTATISTARSYRRIIAASFSYSGSIVLGDESSGFSDSGTATVTTSPNIVTSAGNLVVGFVATYTSNRWSAGDWDVLTSPETLTLLDFGYHVPVSAYNDAPGGTMSNSTDTYAAYGAALEEDAGGASVAPLAVHHLKQMAGN